MTSAFLRIILSLVNVYCMYFTQKWQTVRTDVTKFGSSDRTCEILLCENVKLCYFYHNDVTSHSAISQYCQTMSIYPDTLCSYHVTNRAGKATVTLILSINPTRQLPLTSKIIWH